MGFKSPKISGQQPQGPERHLKVQTSAYGDPIPLVYGEHRIAGNVIWADFFRAHVINPTQGAGKKTGGGVLTSQTYRYTVSVMLCLGEGARDNLDNPARFIDVPALGLARPGDQAITLPDSVIAPGAFGSGASVAEPAQPRRGADPGAWKTKRVHAVGPKKGAFVGAHFLDWTDLPHPVEGTGAFPAPRIFVSPAGATIPRGLTNNDPFGIQQYTKVTTPGTHHYAPENYPGLAIVLNQDMGLGTNASLPNWNFPFRGLQQFWQTDAVPATNGSDVNGPFNTYEAAPDRIVTDLLTNPKHGGGWNNLLSLLPGYIAALGDASPFWNDSGESWGRYVRANGMLISPVYDQETSLNQMLDDLAILTDSAVVWSEGLLKMVPYGDQAASTSIGGVTYTYAPQSDPSIYTTGANIGVRAVLTLDDFLMKGTDALPVTATRKSITPDQQTSAGYFNKVVVEFENRLNGYQKEPAEAKDEASINQLGLIPQSPTSAPAICRKELAADVARRVLKRLRGKRVTYRFTLGWWWLLLEPMDVVTLPGEAIDSAMAGTVVAVRLTSIAENENGELEIEAEQFPAARTPAAASGPPPTDDTDAIDSVDAGGVILGDIFFGDDTGGNPEYWGVMGYYPTLTSFTGDNEEGPVAHVAVNMPTFACNIVALRVFFDQFVPGVSFVRCRVGINVNGVTDRLMFVDFFIGDEGQIKTVRSSLVIPPIFVPAGAAVAVENRFLDLNLSLVPSNVPPYIPQFGLKWQIQWVL